ncbi:MAG: hypothetical protein CM1200mP26_03760 [Acidimicrobiales bacterium]|nr:MAG: hypothetical protein CM1200mP26_03760 [Acidimicrobiales bacterium]
MSDLIPEADGSSERRTSFPAAPPMVIDTAKTYTAEMVTSMGSMTIHLDPIAAPRRSTASSTWPVGTISMG